MCAKHTCKHTDIQMIGIFPQNPSLGNIAFFTAIIRCGTFIILWLWLSTTINHCMVALFLMRSVNVICCCNSAPTTCSTHRLSLSWSVSVYVYICVCVCVHVCSLCIWLSTLDSACFSWITNILYIIWSPIAPEPDFQFLQQYMGHILVVVCGCEPRRLLML